MFRFLKIRKKINKECWNLNYSFIVWLNKRLKVYIKDASKVVDFNFHTYKYRGAIYSQAQVLDKMLNLTNHLKETYWDVDPQSLAETRELLELFMISFNDLWW